MTGPLPDASLDGTYDEGTRTLSVSGDVDDPRAFEAMVSGQLGSTEPTYVDLSDVTFLPSSAIGVLVGARRTAARSGGALRVSSAEGTIAYRVLTVAGFPIEGR